VITRDKSYWDAYRKGCKVFLKVQAGECLVNFKAFSLAFRMGYFDMSDMWYSVKSANK
jgi:hypothetical protein